MTQLIFFFFAKITVQINKIITFEKLYIKWKICILILDNRRNTYISQKQNKVSEETHWVE